MTEDMERQNPRINLAYVSRLMRSEEISDLMRTAKISGVVAGLCFAAYGLMRATDYTKARYDRQLLESPYELRVEDRWGYLKVLADENRDGENRYGRKRENAVACRISPKCTSCKGRE